MDFEAAGLDLGQVEHVVDDVEQVFGRLMGDGQELALLVGIFDRAIHDQPQKAEDRGQRGSKLVRRIGQKLGLEARSFECDGALLVELGQRTGVRIVGVNYKDPPPGGLRFLGRYGNPYAAVGTDPAGRGAIEWGVYGMPETFILAGDGRIAFKHVGPISRESLDAKIIPEIEKLRGTAGS